MPVVGDLAQPRPRTVERLEHAAVPCVGHPVHDAAPVLGPGSEISPEVHVDVVAAGCPADEGDPETLPSAARRSVGRDHVRDRDVVLLAGRAVAHLHPDVVVCLSCPDHLGPEPDGHLPRADRSPEQHRLEPVLRTEDRTLGAEVIAGAGEAGGGDPAVLLARQCAGVDDLVGPALRQVELAEAPRHPAAPLPGHFHGACVDVARLGMHGRAGMTLEHDRVHVEPGQLQRHRQPDRAGPADRHAWWARRHARAVLPWCLRHGALLSRRR